MNILIDLLLENFDAGNMEEVKKILTEIEKNYDF